MRLDYAEASKWFALATEPGSSSSRDPIKALQKRFILLPSTWFTMQFGRVKKVTELIKCSLPINMHLQLNDACSPGPNQPYPLHPRTGNLTLLPTPTPPTPANGCRNMQCDAR